MLSPITPAATAYRRVLNLIGWSLVIFIGLFTSLAVIEELFLTYFSNGILGTALYGLLSSALYMAPFILAGVMFYLFNSKTPTQPIRYDLKLPAVTPLLIMGGLAMITAGAYVNAVMCDLIGYKIPSELVAPQGYDDPATIIMYMSTALAPAFAEEFLFRGVIYGNLRPFGRTQAILISSILFALMHQNIGQFFYTFVGGVAMAIMYELTGNIWCGVLFHMFNNEFAVFTEVLYNGRFGEAIEPFLMLWDAIVLILGCVSILFLVFYYKRKADEKQNNSSNFLVFGVGMKRDVQVYDASVDRGTVLHGMKAPGLIVFAALSVASALATYFVILFADLEALL